LLKVKTKSLPSTPILSPHLGFVFRIGGELVTVESIAGVYLEEIQKD
jgi:hypothetical protein